MRGHCQGSFLHAAALQNIAGTLEVTRGFEMRLRENERTGLLPSSTYGARGGRVP
jgi:hypothetical protein